jgi:hypothetical protein
MNTPKPTRAPGGGRKPTEAPAGRDLAAEQAHLLAWVESLPAGLPSPQLIAAATARLAAPGITAGVVKAITAAPDKSQHRRAQAPQLDALYLVLAAYGFRREGEAEKIILLKRFPVPAKA